MHVIYFVYAPVACFAWRTSAIQCIMPFQPSIIFLIFKQELSINRDCSLQYIHLIHGRTAGLNETPMCVTMALYRPSTRDCVAVVCFARGPKSWHQSWFTLIYYITGAWFTRRPSVRTYEEFVGLRSIL